LKSLGLFANNMGTSNLPPLKLGLIGYPLGHSLSPQLHAAALRSCGMEGEYSLFAIHPDNNGSLNDLLCRVRSGTIQGLNVTIPHKQRVIQYLDDLTPTAEAIGAVNTIYLRNGRLVGDNTDAPGFISDLKRFLDPRISNREYRKSVLVLGAGGSGRAVVYALLDAGWDTSIAARRIEQAIQLASAFTNYHVSITTFNLSNIDVSNIALIVNTTPLGMTPNIDQSPWPAGIPFPKGAAIYDLVYNPSETKLVRDAREQGVPGTTGLGMLIEQAARAFEIWTGKRPDRQIMRLSAEQSPITTL
jgi:shikimate dehydrogenase